MVFSHGKQNIPFLSLIPPQWKEPRSGFRLLQRRAFTLALATSRNEGSFVPGFNGVDDTTTTTVKARAAAAERNILLEDTTHEDVA